MNRIILEPGEVDGGGHVTLSDYRAAHVLQVLNPAPGQTLRVGIVDGPIGTGEVLLSTPRTVLLRCTLTTPAPASPDVALLLALPRPKVLKRLWAPLASLGVREIILTNADAVERNYFDTHWLVERHYRPLLLEGLAQAGITRLPRVSVHRRLKPLIEDEIPARFASATRLLAHPGAAQRIGDVALPPAPSVLLAVGPEGGWIPYETELLASKGFIPVHTGHEILRSDVACIALLALVKERLAMPD